VSRFHNDRGSEHLALGWHAAAAFISAGEFVFSIASAVAAFRMAALLPIAGYFFWFALAAAVVGLFCLAWHVRAVREHLVHIDGLPAESTKGGRV
jgi:hypothetical protein